MAAVTGKIRKYSRTFNLSTNSTCFLCSTDVLCAGTAHNGDQRVNRNSDSGCYRVEGENSYAGKVSLQSICRYLMINFKQFFIRCGTGDGQWMVEQKSISDFSVTLCTQCSAIMLPLSKLCMELELLQMKVDNYLKSLRVVLEHSKTEENSLAQFGDMATTPEGKKIDQEIAKLLRKEIKRKCELKLSQVMPKVKLTKVQLPIRTVTFSSTEIKVNQTIATSTPRSLSPTNYISGDDSSDADATNSSPPPEPRSTPKNRCSEYSSCTNCHPPQMVHVRQQKRHNIVYHLEKWFLSFKQAHLTLAKFKRYCECVLHEQLLSSAKLDESKEISKYKCSYCSYVSELNVLRHHLCFKHMEIIGKKLVKLQRTTTVDEMKAIPLPDRPLGGLRSRDWKCDLCGATFPYNVTLVKHKRLVHGKDILPQGPVLKCEICKLNFRHAASLLKHQKVKHEGLPAFQPNCDKCGKTFYNPSSLIRHQKKEHVRIEEKVRKEKKKSPLPTFESCNQCNPPQTVQSCYRTDHTILHHLEMWLLSSKQSNLSLSTFKKYCEHIVQVELLSSTKLYARNGAPNGKCKCPHCPFSSNIYKLRRHICVRHKHLVSQKLVQLQRTTTVDELTAVELPSCSWSKLDRTKPRTLWKCNDCEETFQQSAYLRRHKMRAHGKAIPTTKRGQTFLRLFHVHEKQQHEDKDSVKAKDMTQVIGMCRSDASSLSLIPEDEQEPTLKNDSPLESQQLECSLEESNVVSDQSFSIDAKPYPVDQDGDECNESQVISEEIDAHSSNVHVEMKVFPDGCMNYTAQH